LSTKFLGTIKSFKGSWIVECEPHVLIRLRRVFPRMSRPRPRADGKRDVVCIANTPEVCRDLEWFAGRFPLELSKDDEYRLTQKANEHREGEHMVQQLIAKEIKPAEFRMALPARDYQKVGAQLCVLTGGTILAFDMGLGKTPTGIYMLMDPKTRPALVVTMTHLPRQWESEFRKFAPQLRTHVIDSTRPYDIAKRCGGQMPDAIIISYSKLSGWKDAIRVRSFIIDEAQEFRNGTETKKGEAGAAIARAASYRLALTGTPFVNMGAEIWNIYEMVRPGVLGTYREFTTEWCVGDSDKPGKVKIKDPVAFGSYLRHAGLIDRKTKADVGRELPKLNKVVQFVDYDVAHLQSVERKATALAEVLLSKTERTRGAKMQAAEELSNLVRQATGVAKMPWVADLVRMLVESGEPVLCYLWHRQCYAIVNERLKDLNPAMYTGSETEKEKAESFRRFTSGETDVMLMSLRAGQGLDGLQHRCSTVVNGELDWSPAIHDQGVARVYRDGQTKPVFVYFPLADSGSDPIVSDILGVKRAQLEGVRDLSTGTDILPTADTDHIKKLAKAYLSKNAVK